jgi:hypothetical protein
VVTQELVHAGGLQSANTQGARAGEIFANRTVHDSAYTHQRCASAYTPCSTIMRKEGTIRLKYRRQRSTACIKHVMWHLAWYMACVMKVCRPVSCMHGICHFCWLSV